MLAVRFGTGVSARGLGESRLSPLPMSEAVESDEHALVREVLTGPVRSGVSGGVRDPEEYVEASARYLRGATRMDRSAGAAPAVPPVVAAAAGEMCDLGGRVLAVQPVDDESLGEGRGEGSPVQVDRLAGPGGDWLRPGLPAATLLWRLLEETGKSAKLELVFAGFRACHCEPGSTNDPTAIAQGAADATSVASGAAGSARKGRSLRSMARRRGVRRSRIGPISSMRSSSAASSGGEADPFALDVSSDDEEGEQAAAEAAKLSSQLAGELLPAFTESMVLTRFESAVESLSEASLARVTRLNAKLTTDGEPKEATSAKGRVNFQSPVGSGTLQRLLFDVARW